MVQSKFTNSDRRFEFHMVELLYVQKFKSLLLFSTEIQPRVPLMPQVAHGGDIYATSWIFAKMTWNPNII